MVVVVTPLSIVFGIVTNLVCLFFTFAEPRQHVVCPIETRSASV